MNKQLVLLQHATLESDRLLLRPFALTDAEDLYEINRDEQTTRYIYPPHKTLEETENLLINFFMQKPIGKYAIELKETGKMVSTFEIHLQGHNNSAEIGFTQNRAYWGNGYMTEAAKLVLDVAFNQLNLTRVYGGCDARNTASGQTLQRIGMTHEGTFRKDHEFNGEYADSHYYSILKEEF